jgi:hypothetical protein
MLYIPAAYISAAGNRLYTISFYGFQDRENRKPHHIIKYKLLRGEKNMDCKETITFSWYTGSITVYKELLLNESAAYLKKLLNTADKNREEVSEELKSYIQEEIDSLDPKSVIDKKRIEKYNKLLSIFDDRKQTREEKAIAKIINLNDTREDYKGVFYNSGKYCAINGYTAIRLSFRPYGIADAKKDFDINKAIGDIRRYSAELTIPAAATIRKDVKIAKNGVSFDKYHIERCGRNIKVLYDFGYNKPLVNTEYLLMILDALPDCKVFYDPERGYKSPLYIVSGENDGILLPVKKEQEFEEAPEETEDNNIAAQEENAAESAESAENATNIAEAEEPEETEEQEYIRKREETEKHLSCLAAAVKVSENDNNILQLVVRQYKRGFITEDEAIKLLLFPVSTINKYALALPPHIEQEETITDPENAIEPEKQIEQEAQAIPEPEKTAAAWYNPREETAEKTILIIAAAFTDTAKENAETVCNISAESIGESAAGSLSKDSLPRQLWSIPRPPWARGEYLVVFGRMPLLPLLRPSIACSASSVSSASAADTLSASSFCSISALEYSRQPRPP